MGFICYTTVVKTKSVIRNNRWIWCPSNKWFVWLTGSLPTSFKSAFIQSQWFSTVLALSLLPVFSIMWLRLWTEILLELTHLPSIVNVAGSELCYFTPLFLYDEACCLLFFVHFEQLKWWISCKQTNFKENTW